MGDPKLGNVGRTVVGYSSEMMPPSTPEGSFIEFTGDETSDKSFGFERRGKDIKVTKVDQFRER